MREQFNLVVVGHVDHGKSTVIGRLLADTGSLPDGKLEQVRRECERSAKPFEYAFLLDALKAEQAQGITIDTARCFFKSELRDYIIIDAPGHIEFLKNMVTGAARAEAALLIIDAKEGVRENSRRHGYMLSMLGIRQVVVCVNKMDLADYSQARFDDIVKEYGEFLVKVGIQPLAYVPLAAFHGENLIQPSALMGWYTQPPLLKLMDTLVKEADQEHKPLRFPVQDVYKFTEEGDDRRIIAGRVETGSFKAGDEVCFYPGGKKARVKTLEEFNVSEPQSFGPGKSAGFTLEPEIYVKAGDLMVLQSAPPPQVAQRIRAHVFWMSKEPFVQGKKYKLKIASAETPVWLDEIRGVLDASNLSSEVKRQVGQYEVGECVLETFKPIAFDLTTEIAQTSRFVLVDHYEIVGGGIIQESLGQESTLLDRHLKHREKSWERSPITPGLRAGRYGQRSSFILLTGGSEKLLADLGRRLEEVLFLKNRFVYYLGMKNALLGLQADQDPENDFSEAIRRIGEVAHLFTDAGAIFITSISQLEDSDRKVLGSLASPADLYEVEYKSSMSVEDQADWITQELYERNILVEYYL